MAAAILITPQLTDLLHGVFLEVEVFKLVSYFGGADQLDFGFSTILTIFVWDGLPSWAKLE